MPPALRFLWLIGMLATALYAGGANVARAQAPLPADDIQPVADKIDDFIAAQWAKAGAVPCSPADDAEFLRRVTLHISGCIPTVATARQFLEDTSPDKRRRYVEELLDDSGYIVNYSRFWRGVMLPEGDGEFQSRLYPVLFEAWLRQQLNDNLPFDELARQVINTAGSTTVTPRPVRAANAGGEPTAAAFVVARKSVPEEVASATSRVFLGIRVECAQCHDHPFDHWKRDEFWSLAAFFSGLTPQQNGGFNLQISEIPNRREIKIPNTEQVVQARYLGGDAPVWTTDTKSRAALADWVTSAENPYFARTAVNRYWSNLFGVGLVDPVDDFNEDNVPSHPELLAYLAGEFTRHKFDLKFLIRAMTASKTYQLSSRRSHESQDDPQLFARMAVQGLTPAQILDSLVQASGRRRDFAQREQIRFNGVNLGESEFEETFAIDAQAAARREATILQSLLMMNGIVMAAATSSSDNRFLPQPEPNGVTVRRLVGQGSGSMGHTLLAVCDAPFLNLAGKIETLYLATLTRKPTDAELRRVQEYLQGGRSEKEALSDVYWALLNTTEFMLNH